MDLIECIQSGGHDLEGTEEWHTISSPDEELLHEGEYRRAKCKKCEVEFTEARSIEE